MHITLTLLLITFTLFNCSENVKSSFISNGYGAGYDYDTVFTVADTTGKRTAVSDSSINYFQEHNTLSFGQDSTSTIFTWIEKYADNRVDTISCYAEWVVIDTAYNRYSISTYKENLHGSLQYYESEGIKIVYINYTDKRIIEAPPLYNFGNYAYILQNELDTITADTEVYFDEVGKSFTFHEFNFSHSNRPEWISDIEPDSWPTFGFRPTDYPQKIESDGYKGGSNAFLTANTKGVSLGVYNWTIILENYYGFRDTVAITTRVVRP